MASSRLKTTFQPFLLPDYSKIFSMCRFVLLLCPVPQPWPVPEQLLGTAWLPFHQDVAFLVCPKTRCHVLSVLRIEMMQELPDDDVRFYCSVANLPCSSHVRVSNIFGSTFWSFLISAAAMGASLEQTSGTGYTNRKSNLAQFFFFGALNIDQGQ